MYGAWTLVPPLLAILLEMVKKDVLASLFIGTVAASLIMNGAIFLTPIVSEYMTAGWTNNASLLITIVIVGTMMGQINASGGFMALSAKIKSRVKSARGAKVLAWLLCIVCATDDGMATVGAGSIARPVTDSYKVPREKLAFIVSSTGSNFLSLMPYSMYILFGAGLIATYAGGDGYATYLQALPWNFYALLSIVAAGLFAAEILPDFGPMKRAEVRAAQSGALCPEGRKIRALNELPEEEMPADADIWSFILPIGTMLVVFVVLYLITGAFQMVSAALCGCVVAFGYPVLRGRMKFRDISAHCFAGFQSTVPMFMILFLAFTFAAAVNSMGFGDYVVGLLHGRIGGAFLPLFSFLLAGAVAYCTGSFARGLIIMTPIALPLALSAQASIPLVFAACMGGSQFGDQTSPISDIFIMSSMTAGIDVADSARTLLPYKLCLFGLAAAAYLGIGLLG